MGVNFLELIAGTSVDLRGLEEGLKRAEAMTEEVAKKIAGHWGLIGISIATAIAGAALIAIEKAVKVTAEWGLEMEHLSNRMGMTARETATVIGIMERFGVSANLGARAMQMLSTQVRQTQNSLDPFATKLGKTLGALRDTSGHVLSMGQVLDLVRQKVSGASSDSERLQIATSLLGARIGGQLVPMLKLSNDEWERQKKSVQETLGPVEKAAELALGYKQATAELEQQLRGLQVALGTKLLPSIIEIIHSFSFVVDAYKAVSKENSALSQALSLGDTNPFSLIAKEAKYATYSVDLLLEKLGIVGKGTAKNFLDMDASQEAGRKAALEKEKEAEAQRQLAEEIDQTEQNERKIVQMVKEHISLMEKARQLGVETTSRTEEEAELQQALVKFEEQRILLEAQLNSNLTQDQREKVETSILKNRVDAAKLVADYTMKGYKEEELQLKANGAFTIGNEIALLQRKLTDERIVGDERLKVEAELFSKRKNYAEEAEKLARKLGFATIDQEISFRKQRAAELLGKGDAIGAAQELVKARDLVLKQADETLEFTKKIRVVSLQDEIEYQKQKLQVVKGNAEEEMKILSKIADIDKELYDKRLAFSLSYTASVVDQYNKIEKAAKTTGEVETFERAKIDSERQLVQTTREAGGVLRGGGTEEQRKAAVEFAQFVNKQVEQMQSLGKNVSSIWKDAASVSKDILKAASGGEEVRAPGGPSPTIGSLLSPAEGLATETLARGSDIPRLDTSFTDLAIRIRDVLLGAIPNIQNFSNQLALATKQMALITGSPNNPGIIGPGGGTSAVPSQGSNPSGIGTGTPAPTAGPGSQQPVVSTPATGIASTSNQDALLAALSALPDKLLSALQTQAAANAQSIQDAINSVLSSRQQGVSVAVTIDPSTGDLIVGRIVQELSAA